jgi:GTP-binding protein
VVGRPNAGKSTLINTLLGEERLIAFDQPGTTRDSVAIDFERAGKPYTLIDTAGMRRRAKVHDVVEKFSVVKTLQAIEDCNVCVLMLDGSHATSPTRTPTLPATSSRRVGRWWSAVNKWDGAQSRPARPGQARPRPQAPLPAVRQAALHQRPDRGGRRAR